MDRPRLIKAFVRACLLAMVTLAAASSPASLRLWTGGGSIINWSNQQEATPGGGTFADLSQAPSRLGGQYAVTNLPAVSNQFYWLKK